MRYVNHSEKGNWVKSAYTGFRTKRGDCYTYYSVSKALLDKAGIANLEVIRTDGHHWWSLVDCGNGCIILIRPRVRQAEPSAF